MTKIIEKLGFSALGCFSRRVGSTLAVAFVLGMSPAVHAETGELSPVEAVDVDRYLGQWFEIARLPERFQTFCTKVTADYTLKDNGRIGVVNRCRLFDPTFGIPVTIRGEAYPVDTSNARLKVEFFNGATVGDYWVLELDPDYQWALVGEPSRSSLFVLSRTPELRQDIFEELIQKAQDKHGYDVSELIVTRQ